MPKSSDSPVKILLADDSVTMHRAVSLALKKESYDLICVDNRKDALRLIHEHRPHVALLDLEMPEKTGIEVARDVRSDATLAEVQLVLLCGSFDEVDEKDVENAPVDARLWKPFESHVLLAMLRTLLSSRGGSLPAAHHAPTRTSGLDPTAPQATRPSEPTANAARPPVPPPPKPRAPAPKSRKDEVLESESAKIEIAEEDSRLTPAQRQKIRQSVEATRPLNVADLFDPSKRPPPPGPIKRDEIPKVWDPVSETASESSQDEEGDFSKALARETFGAATLPEELPAPQMAFEKTAPVPKASASDAGVQPKDDPFINNLWSPEELSSFDEESSFAESEDTHAASTLESSEATGEMNQILEHPSPDLEFEILDPHLSPSQDSPTTTAHQTNPEGLGSWSAPPLHPGFETLQAEATRELHSSLLREKHIDLPHDASAASSEDIRKIVSEEVRRAFHSWLRDELQRQLNDVMSELDSELS